MKAREFIAQLAPVDLDRLSQIFHALGDRCFELQLTSSMRLRDATDFRAFFYELASAAQFPRSYAPPNRCALPTLRSRAPGQRRVWRGHGRGKDLSL